MRGNMENEYWLTPLLSLKLIKSQTYFFVKDRQFRQCKFLILTLPVYQLNSHEGMDSLDEIIEDSNISEVEQDMLEAELMLTPEEQFWGHCSNLQVWVEHDYDTRFLHYSLSFPLLKELALAGDEKVRFKLREEIVKRIERGWKPIIYYFFEENYYLDFLEPEDFQDYLFPIFLKDQELFLDYINEFGFSLKFFTSSQIKKLLLKYAKMLNPEIIAESCLFLEENDLIRILKWLHDQKFFNKLLTCLKNLPNKKVKRIYKLFFTKFKINFLDILKKLPEVNSYFFSLKYLDFIIPVIAKFPLNEIKKFISYIKKQNPIFLIFLYLQLPQRNKLILKNELTDILSYCMVHLQDFIIYQTIMDSPPLYHLMRRKDFFSLLLILITNDNEPLIKKFLKKRDFYEKLSPREINCIFYCLKDTNKFYYFIHFLKNKHVMRLFTPTELYCHLTFIFSKLDKGSLIQFNSFSYLFQSFTNFHLFFLLNKIVENRCLHEGHVIKLLSNKIILQKFQSVQPTLIVTFLLKLSMIKKHRFLPVILKQVKNNFPPFVKKSFYDALFQAIPISVFITKYSNSFTDINEHDLSEKSKTKIIKQLVCYNEFLKILYNSPTIESMNSLENLMKFLPYLKTIIYENNKSLISHYIKSILKKSTKKDNTKTYSHYLIGLFFIQLAMDFFSKRKKNKVLLKINRDSMLSNIIRTHDTFNSLYSEYFGLIVSRFLISKKKHSSLPLEKILKN